MTTTINVVRLNEFYISDYNSLETKSLVTLCVDHFLNNRVHNSKYMKILKDLEILKEE